MQVGSIPRHMALRQPLDIDEGPVAVVVFARIDDLVADQSNYADQLRRQAVAVLKSLGIRLVLVSKSAAAYVRQVQYHLNIAEPFVCEGGAAVHIPGCYLGKVPPADMSAGAWEIFRFSPPDRTAAVNLVRDLFVAQGYSDVLTIGIGCDLDDYGVLGTVDIPVVVRDRAKEQKELLRYVPGAYLTTATGIEGWSEALIGP